MAGVRASVLLTGVQTGLPSLVAAGSELVAAGLYILGARRLADRGRLWPARRQVSFLTGVAAVWVATGSGLAVYDESSVTLHLVQHVLLMMVAPPLLALGRPLGLAAQAGRRKLQVGVTRLVRSRVATALTHPLTAGIFYFGTMWALLVDRRVYDYVIAHQPVHDASHGLLLAVGLLYWTPLVAPDSSVHRLSHPARMLLLLVTMPLEALPGAWIRYQSSPIDAINTLADTRAAGELLLVAATGACSLWLCAVAAQWFAFAVREERREAARTPAAGWTVPWWVQAADPAPPGPAGVSDA